jgi:hypothetical protein
MIANGRVRGALPALGQPKTPATIPHSDRLGKEFRHRSFQAGGQPARVQLGGRLRCPWLTADDRSFPPVLARTWHGSGRVYRVPREPHSGAQQRSGTVCGLLSGVLRRWRVSFRSAYLLHTRLGGVLDALVGIGHHNLHRLVRCGSLDEGEGQVPLRLWQFGCWLVILLFHTPIIDLRVLVLGQEALSVSRRAGALGGLEPSTF